MTALQLAISATFTAEPLEPSLSFWLEELGLEAKLAFAPYDQVFQSLLDPTSLFARNAAGINVALLRLEDLLPTVESGELEHRANELVSAARSSATTTRAPTLIFTTRASPAMAEKHGSLLSQLEARLASELQAIPSVYFTSSAELDADYPVAEHADPHAEELGRVPYTSQYFAALGTMIARRVHALRVPPKKLIAVDCDETLWKGVAGEDGPSGIELDPPHRALQEFLREQHERGVLLAIASKNNPADVLEIFEKRADLILGKDRFARLRLDWGPKSESLRAIAAELSLGLDSFVFLDDNPVEIAEVEAACPEVLALALPAPENISHFLRHLWPLDRLQVTAEDRARNEQYRDSAKRDALRASSASLEEFLRSLDMQLTIRALTPESLPRVAQLTQRTNQFNASTIRRTEGELAQLLEINALQGLTVDLKDRFGDYGMVGVMLFGARDRAIQVDSFILSCRALGKGVEHRMVRALGERAKEEKLSGVFVPCVTSGKNQPALDFFESISGARRESKSDGFAIMVPTEIASVMEYRPARESARAGGPHRAAAAAAAGAAAAREREPGRTARASLYRRIANELSSAEEIARAVEAKRSRARPELERSYVAPRTTLEQAIAGELARVLNMERAGIDDNFFELGGTSLTVVQLISRLRESLGVELPIERFWSAPTVRGLAEICGALAVDASSDESIAARLLEVDRLSEAEVDAMIEAEMRARGEVSDDLSITLSARSTRPAAQPERATIASLGIITRSRPAALNRCLPPYIESAKKFGRRHAFVVADDTPEPGARAETRRMLAELERRMEGPQILYAGEEEKTRYAKRLIGLGLPEETIRFALFDPEHAGYTVGANRNALLLDAAGELLFITDDDTEHRLGAHPDSGSRLGKAEPPEDASRSRPDGKPIPGKLDPVAISSGLDPADLYFHAHREAALLGVRPAEVDLFQAHEELLGRELSAILRERNEPMPRLDKIDPALAARLESPQGRALITFTGLAGDCAWGAPFGSWGAPLGCLVLNDASHARLVRSPAEYKTATTTRELVRVVSAPTISDGAYAMCTFVGLDLRDLLPPFFPVQRGQDLVFGTVLWRCFEHAYFGHVPYTLVHAPMETRRFWPGEIFRTASSFDTAKLLFAAICTWPSGQVPLYVPNTPPAASRERLRALGAHLEHLGGLPLLDFEHQIRTEAAKLNELAATGLHAHLKRHEGAPDYWVQDLSKYADLLRRASAREDYCVPLDLLNNRSAADARALAKRLIRAFGRLLSVWPDLVDAARDLRAAGERVAAPVSGTGKSA